MWITKGSTSGAQRAYVYSNLLEYPQYICQISTYARGSAVSTLLPIGNNRKMYYVVIDTVSDVDLRQFSAIGYRRIGSNN